MAEYTYEDIIMDPEDPRLEGAIGKECYFSDYPKQLLNGARNNSPEYLDCLTDIRKEAACTFVDKNGSGWILIIIKKEEPKPEYVPFENAEEFLNAYDYTNHSIENGSVENKLINYGGIWLKDNEIDAYCMVTEIWDTGVVIGNKNITIGETTVFNDITSWDELLEDCTFIDGKPCGKEVK